VDVGAVCIAAEVNLAEHAGHLHRHAPGMTVTESAEVFVADSGLADDTFNIVARARFADGDAGARIKDTVAGLAHDRPYCWWVGPASAPTDLSARLAAAGLPATGHEVAMAADLHDRQPSAGWHRLGGLDLRVASTPAELADFAVVVAANWDPPAESVREFFARTTRWALAAGCPSRYLVGYDGGEAVAAAEVVFAGGVAGIYNVCTLAAHRRRGRASALMRAALGIAVDAGIGTAVLQASTQGEAIYRRLGFRVVGEFVEHTLRP
jgi:ribosomal protein S18 acetylase RimI-like enzyme